MKPQECVIKVNIVAIILEITGASVIGWKNEKLKGRPLLTIIPESYWDGFLLAVSYYLISGEMAILDERIPVHIVTAKGKELPMTLYTVKEGPNNFLNILTKRDEE